MSGEGTSKKGKKEKTPEQIAFELAKRTEKLSEKTRQEDYNATARNRALIESVIEENMARAQYNLQGQHVEPTYNNPAFNNVENSYPGQQITRINAAGKRESIYNSVSENLPKVYSQSYYAGLTREEKEALVGNEMNAPVSGIIKERNLEYENAAQRGFIRTSYPIITEGELPKVSLKPKLGIYDYRYNIVI